MSSFSGLVRRTIGLLALVAFTLAGTAFVGAATPDDALVVVVFPFASQGGPADAAGRISTGIATQIGSLGGITVKPAPAGTVQRDFLTAARKAGAEYYLSGYVTPLGTELSVVSQLVSTRSGTIVWSSRSQLSPNSDAASDGKIIHDQILQYAGGHGNTALAVPQQTPANAAVAPPTRTASVPAPVAAVTALPAGAVAAAPGVKTAAVMEFNGSAGPEVLAYMSGAVIETLKRYGVQGSHSQLTLKDVTTMGPAACAESGSTWLIAGNIESRTVNVEFGVGFQTIAELTLTGLDCSNPQAKPQTITERAQGMDQQTTIDITINDALKSLLAKK